MKHAAATECKTGEGPRRRCALALGLAQALSLAGAGCQFARYEAMVHDSPVCTAQCDDVLSRGGREADMNRRWQSHRLSELKAALGQPKLLMGIPGGGNPPGFVAVYGLDPASGCIDAFALVYDTDPVIRVYHCR